VLYAPRTSEKMLERCGDQVIGVRTLRYSWLRGCNTPVALGVGKMGKPRLVCGLLGVLAPLPCLPVAWCCPELLRVCASAPA
jgi:hypothetical protein